MPLNKRIKMTTPHGFAIIFFLFLLGCTSQPVKQTNDLTKDGKPLHAGYLLMFTETRPQQKERNIRIIITDQFLRIDEGHQSENAVLFNRKSKTITQINPEQKLKTRAKNIKPAFPLHWRIQSQPSHAIMRTQTNNNATAMHYLFYLNEEPCYNVVAIEDHLVEAVTALREYNQAMANKQKETYVFSEDKQCRDAITVFDPDVRTQHGFPLREWSSFGYQRFLVDFKRDIVFPASLFTLRTHEK